MPTTLYGTFPILLPTKTVTVSSYGLEKTSGTILFKHGQEGGAFDLAEQNGSLYPDPQIRTTDIGLMEMSFDAYRDTGATSGVFATEVLNFSKSFKATVTEPVGDDFYTTNYNWNITEIWLADSYTEKKVLAANLGSVFLQPFPQLLGKRMLKRTITGDRPSGGASILPLTWSSQVSSVSRRNFGDFDEVDIVTSLQVTIE
jgi:hypothetical protein